MYIPHAANSKQTVRSSEVSCLEGRRFRSKVLVGWRKFERWQLDELVSFGVHRLEYDH